ncbi:hypothetical protein [Streptomyces synnematoformans]|uniref:Uncharacterized protein n=1 Tax=Streptomyces synnematoformans TaxID=415721 RepID=A0ABP5JT09_9ACTN
MTSVASDGKAAPNSGPPLGHVNLFAPSDWFDLLDRPTDEGLAQERFTELTRLAFSAHSPDIRDAIVEALMHTRRAFLDDGMLSCGLVTLPETEDGPALWQICSGVVEIGSIDTDLDIGSAFASFLGERVIGEGAYIESFPTAIGTGVGLISTPQVFSDGSVSLFPETTLTADDPGTPEVTLGLAVALAAPPGGGKGLLVVGQSLDAGQVRELACVVALIAGKSTIEVYAKEAGDKTRT